MNININQNEIVKAIKSHVVAQGINLTGKTVTITFTAGRKEAGLTADIQIEDATEVAVSAPLTPAPVLEGAGSVGEVGGGTEVQPANDPTPDVAADAPVADAAPAVEDGISDRPLGTIPATDAPTTSLFS